MSWDETVGCSQGTWIHGTIFDQRNLLRPWAKCFSRGPSIPPPQTEDEANGPFIARSRWGLVGRASKRPCKDDCHQRPRCSGKDVGTNPSWVCRFRPGQSHQSTMLSSTLSDCPKTGTALSKSESNTWLSGGQQSFLGGWKRCQTELPSGRENFHSPKPDPLPPGVPASRPDPYSWLDHMTTSDKSTFTSRCDCKSLFSSVIPKYITAPT